MKYADDLYVAFPLCIKDKIWKLLDRPLSQIGYLELMTISRRSSGWLLRDLY